MSVKYSIIIPVYNKEEYLNECIDSVVNQNYEDYELILINDGSQDNSLSICNHYKNKYKNIIVIDKDNSGVSETRNIGIQKASGDYILFLDGDDVISPVFFKTIDYYLNDCDLLLFRSCRKYKEIITSFSVDTNIESLDLLSDYTMQDILQEIIYNRKLIKCNFNFNRVTDYIISRKLLLEKNILFEKRLRIGEDKIFNFDLFQNINKIKYIDMKLYYIRTNSGSVMASYSENANQYNRDMLNAFNERIDKIENFNLKESLKSLSPCLSFVAVWNSITSNYCHPNNLKSFKDKSLSYKIECNDLLDKNALKYLTSYHSYLFHIFNYPFILIYSWNRILYLSNLSKKTVH